MLINTSILAVVEVAGFHVTRHVMVGKGECSHFLFNYPFGTSWHFPCSFLPRQEAECVLQAKSRYWECYWSGSHFVPEEAHAVCFWVVLNRGVVGTCVLNSDCVFGVS